MILRAIEPRDAASWLDMRCALFGDTRAVHSREIEAFFAGACLEPQAVLVAERSGEVVGFAELSTRPYAEGCTSRDVGYLEGWYVAPHARGTGAGRALVEAAEAWAAGRGCSELASDSELDDASSRSAHLACGFREVARIRCYRKPLSGPGGLPRGGTAPGAQPGRTHVILYVSDQDASTAFYSQVLSVRPRLHVPGMTELDLPGGAVLGLMPETAIRRLLGDALPDPAAAAGVPRAELYLVVEDACAFHRRALESGARELSPVRERDWGHRAGYSLDRDGHVLAFAELAAQPERRSVSRSDEP